jgi:pyruvate ferredoxin oxidoreductase gamma subunit
VRVFDGLPASGYVLINSTRSFDELGLEDLRKRLLPERCCTVPATQLALERVGRPLPNAALLGAFAAMTNQVAINFIERAVKERFPGRMGEVNAAAALAGYDVVVKKAVIQAQAS